MQDRRRGKTEAEKLAQKQKANRTVLSRTMIMMLICTVVLFTPLVFTLFRIMILEHDKYEKMAIGNQTKTTKLTAERGVIYDRNMNILASSVSAENVFLDPMEIENEKQDTGVLAKGLSEILGVEADFVLKQAADSAYRYKTIQKKITPEKAQEVREFINKNEIKGVHLEPDARRHYPYRSLAAQVIGFVNTDNSGTEGLEAYYDTSLTGNEGKVITTKGNSGTEMLYTYEKYYDAQNGNDLVLTIDSTVQYYLEKNLENAIDKYTVLNGAFGIVMDVNTGEILGMATLGSYDPNNYLEIYDTQKAEALEELYQKTLTYTKGSDDYKAGIDEYNSGVAAARLRQWRNRPVSDGYEPGSTFKLVTLAAALNENCVTLNDSFSCGGRADFAGRSQTLHCWKHEGHGEQTTEQALGNSCNIAFANIGLKLGGARFYDSARAFGLMQTTGIDLPGEARGYFFPRESLTGASTASLISASFGQTFKVTPLQMVRAISAIVNGGYLLKPYVVSEVRDADGNIVQNNERTVLRQVISEETSKTMRRLMEFVVSDGTAGQAKTAGYRIGGKTGTSEKIDEYNPDGSPVEDKMVSFVGVAPINDPKYLTLVVLDTPSRETGLYISGGIMAAPTVRDIFTDVLPYLGVEPDYSDEDIRAVNVAVPDLSEMTLSEAESVLRDRSLRCRTVGDGTVVTGQIPVPGAEIPGDAQVVLYLGAEVPQDEVTVPDFRGMGVGPANTTASDYGLYLQAKGSDRGFANYIYVTHQSVEPGTTVPRGTTITVEFTDNRVQD